MQLKYKSFQVILILPLLLPFIGNTQTLEWWHHQESTSGVFYISSAIDSSENVYTIGRFSDTLSFQLSGISSTVHANGGQDAFIQKNSPSGELQWVYHLSGGSLWEDARDICIDSNGDLIICGNFQDTVNFDPTNTNTTLFSNGNDDVFILKLSGHGVFQWVKQIGSPSQDRGQDCIVDSQNNVYVSGTFSDTLDANPGVGISTHICSPGNNNSFLLKLDSLGNFVWFNNYGNEHNDYINGLTIDNQNNLYLIGSFKDSINFNPNGNPYWAHALFNNSPAYVLKVDQNGQIIWVKHTNGNYGAIGSDVICDDEWNVIVCGSFNGSIDFDPGPGNYSLSSSQNENFLWKLDQNGSFLWVKKMGFSFPSYEDLLSTDPYENIYCIGNFSGTTDLNPGSETHNVTCNDSNSVLVIEFDPNGEFEKAIVFEGNMFENLSSINVSKSWGIYLSGIHQGTFDLDPGIDTVLVNNIGISANAFLLKLDNCSSQSHIDTLNCFEFTSPSGVTYYSDTSFYDTIPNNAGCDSIIKIDLSITHLDTSIIQAGASLIAQQSTAQYQWIDCSTGNPILNATGQGFTPSNNGSYACQIAFNNCVTTTSCLEITNVGITHLNLESIDIFPNPSSGEFSVKTSEDAFGIIQIYDVSGRLVKQLTLSDGLIFNLNQVGIYHCKIQSTNSCTSIKLIVNK